jgi:hypothetical protein
MRASWLLLATLSFGCTSPNDGQQLDGGDDQSVGSGGDDLSQASQDLSVSGDLAMPAQPDLAMPQDLSGIDLMGVFVCGSNLCSSTQTCCVTAANGMFSGACTTGSCPDGGVPVACEHPQDCKGDPCCMNVANGSPTDVACTTSMSACVPNINIGTQSGPTRLCNTSADCTAGPVTTNDPDCCTYVKYGVHMCFNKTVAGLSGGKFTCP